jgi:hypothetical protein
MSLTIRLDGKTVEDAEVEARMRHQVSREAGVVDCQIGKQSSEVTDLVGLLGEVGFSKMFGFQRDEEVRVRSGTADFTGHNGDLIEVKSTHYKNPHLLVPAYFIDGKLTVKEPIAVYVLMRVDFQARTVEFLGWCQREELIREDRLQFFRGASRKSFVMPCHELEQLDPLTEGIIAASCKARGLDVSLTNSVPTA